MNNDFSNQVLVKKSFRDKDLRGANFAGATLKMVDMGRAQLDKSNLTGIKAENVNWESASLIGANISNSVIVSSNLKSAMLLRLESKNTIYSKTDLSEAYAGGADFGFSTFNRCKTKNIYLGEANLFGIRTKKTIFKDAAELPAFAYSIFQDLSGKKSKKRWIFFMIIVGIILINLILGTHIEIWPWIRDNILVIIP